MKIEKHIDGKWRTSWYKHKGHAICIKSKPGHGIKVHIYATDKNSSVIKTLRFSFILPKTILEKAREFIDGA